MPVFWLNSSTLKSRNYICGYCGEPLASEKGFSSNLIDDHGNTIQNNYSFIYICHYCGKPTFFEATGSQHPGSSFGRFVNHIPSQEVANLYNEARECMKVSAYTASVLCSRKLLMNVAVSKGAKEGLSFAEYVSYLADKGFIPPDGKDWIDHIRKKGNEATHEIKLMNREDAEELISFMEMLLKFIYEFPAIIRSKIEDKPH